VEIWEDDILIGGLYGIAIGKVFFGESMFSHRSNASKIALMSLCERLINWGYELIDCQVYSEHLISLGAEEIPRSEFCMLLEKLCSTRPGTESWGKESMEL
jgi:leucyl/phenylalanyl-tRNA--protein transferase